MTEATRRKFRVVASRKCEIWETGMIDIEADTPEEANRLGLAAVLDESPWVEFELGERDDSTEWTVEDDDVTEISK